MILTAAGRRTPVRSAAGLLAGLLAVLLAVPWAVAAAGPANAATYRYWTYWKAAPGQSAWAFSAAGGSARVADGAVEGWRFALSGVAGSGATQPRATPSFDRICAGSAPVPGGVRVAVVVDFGADDARPPGEVQPRGVTEYCAVRTPTMTGYEALGDDLAPWPAGSVRIQGGLVCGVDGYPRTECGALAEAPPTPPAPSPPAPAPSRSAAAVPQAPAATPPGGTTRAPSPAAAATPPSPAAGPTALAGETSAAPADPAPDGLPSPSAPSPLAADAAEAGPVEAADGTDPSPGPPAPALAGLALIAGLGGAAWWRMRMPR